MKYNLVLATAGLVTGAVASRGYVHQHAHQHAHKARADVTTWVEGPVETVYVLDGKKVDADEVEEGVSKGIYVLLTDTPSNAPAEFFQKGASSTDSSDGSSTTTSDSSTTAEASSTTTTSLVAPTTTTTTPVAVPTTSKAATSSSSAAASASSGSTSNPTGAGLSSKFPSGKIKCSHFPSDYGAIPVDWMNIGGWSGIQKTSGYTVGASSISDIVTVVAGMGDCHAGCFCSYACPAGYQKNHWPTAQGSTGQSIGGLWCNADGYLELTNSAHDTLCGAGTGQVKVTNNLKKNVAICRTDYPGTESETVPLNTLPGQTYELTCPDANTYYSWGGKPTSAQYYINPQGVGVDQACKWGDGSTQTGNWAPLNLGVGKGLSGETFISMFYNKPTNPNPYLDYSIEIKGGISGSCKYTGGTFYSNGVASDSGCTVSVQGVATYVLS